MLFVSDHGCHRELDRERGKLEQQEKKIIADIKKMAKTGQMVRPNFVNRSHTQLIWTCIHAQRNLCVIETLDLSCHR